MMRLELTAEEAETLREILSAHLADLRMEVASTDSMAFRERLKETEAVLKTLIAKLDDAA
jgi:hypothetical protein